MLAPLISCLAAISGQRTSSARTAHEGVVDVAALVGGQYYEAVVAFDPLQQVSHLLVGIFIVRVADIGALAEQRIRLVEEQNPLFVFGLVEQVREILSRFRP